MSDLQQSSQDKETLTTGLTQLQEQQATLETSLSTLQTTLSGIDSQVLTSEEILEEVADIHRITTYFSDSKNFSEAAKNYKSIHQLAQTKYTLLTGEIHNFRSTQITTKQAVLKELETAEAALYQTNEEIASVEKTIKVREGQEEFFQEKDKAFKERITQKTNSLEGIDTLSLTWSVAESDDYNGQKSGDDDYMGTLNIVLNFERMTDKNLNHNFWFFKNAVVNVNSSGVLQMSADVQGFSSSQSEDDLLESEINLTIILQLIANPLTVQNSESTTETRQSETTITLIPELFSQAETEGTDTMQGSSVSQGGAKAIYTRTLKYTFKNTGTKLLFVHEDRGEDTIGAWSESHVVHNLLESHNLNDKENDYLLLRDEISSQDLRQGIKGTF